MRGHTFTALSVGLGELDPDYSWRRGSWSSCRSWLPFVPGLYIKEDLSRQCCVLHRVRHLEFELPSMCCSFDYA